MGFNPERPHYDFDLDLIHADLARMHLNRRDSVSVLSALVEARASGRTLDDLNGKVTVGDVVYRYNADTLRTTRLTLDGQNSAGSKYLSLQSEFADATFRSRTDYKTVFEYLRSSLEKYIPLFYDERKARKRAAGAVSVVDDYSVLSVDVKHFTPVADAVADGLQIADGSQLRLLFNPANDKLSLKATSEYIERERMLATRLNLNATNRGDSLSVYLRSEDFYVGTFHMPQLSVMAVRAATACGCRRDSTIRRPASRLCWGSKRSSGSRPSEAGRSTCGCCRRTSAARGRRGRSSPAIFRSIRRA